MKNLATGLVFLIVLLLTPCQKTEGSSQRKNDGTDVDYAWVKNATGCQSFVSLLRADDEEIVDAIPAEGSHRKTFVCFHPDDDVFMIVTYRVPVTLHKQKNGVSVAVTPMIFRRYSKGAASNYFYPNLLLTWVKQGDQLLGQTDVSRTGTTAEINSTEVVVNGSYKQY